MIVARTMSRRRPKSTKRPGNVRTVAAAVVLLLLLGGGLIFAAIRRSRAATSASNASCCDNLPARFAAAPATTASILTAPVSTSGMVWIPPGEFTMGTDDPSAYAPEHPTHRVRVSGFWMDETDVSNAQFAEFVKATGYITTAERAPDWEELKKQVPPGTPRPPNEMLVAASLVFQPTTEPVPTNDVSQWWHWTPGADWRQPEGPGSSIDGRMDHPVVHVSWDDAVAYATWARKRLPTEAEWEYAARGGLEGKTFCWGDAPLLESAPQCNTWQGVFPSTNTRKDGFLRTSPVKHFKPNGYGLYDMAGNVWQWCADWYRADAYVAMASSVSVDPPGPSDSLDPEEPTAPKHVVRGGSFLCNASYCSSYRVTARRGNTADTSMSHTGFRCVRSADSKPQSN